MSETKSGFGDTVANRSDECGVVSEAGGTPPEEWVKWRLRYEEAIKAARVWKNEAENWEGSCKLFGVRDRELTAALVEAQGEANSRRDEVLRVEKRLDSALDERGRMADLVREKMAEIRRLSHRVLEMEERLEGFRIALENQQRRSNDLAGQLRVERAARAPVGAPEVVEQLQKIAAEKDARLGTIEDVLRKVRYLFRQLGTVMEEEKKL